MYYVIHLLDSKSYKGGKKMERTKMCDIPSKNFQCNFKRKDKITKMFVFEKL